VTRDVELKGKGKEEMNAENNKPLFCSERRKT
jgi:hypothetical protein